MNPVLYIIHVSHRKRVAGPRVYEKKLEILHRVRKDFKKNLIFTRNCDLISTLITKYKILDTLITWE